MENDSLSHIYNFKSSLWSRILKFSLFVRRTPKLKLLSCSAELLSQLSSGAPMSILGLTSVQLMHWSSLFQFHFTAFLGRTIHLDVLNDILLNSSPSQVFPYPQHIWNKNELENVTANYVSTSNEGKKIVDGYHFSFQTAQNTSHIWLKSFIFSGTLYLFP